MSTSDNTPKTSKKTLFDVPSSTTSDVAKDAHMGFAPPAHHPDEAASGHEATPSIGDFVDNSLNVEALQEALDQAQAQLAERDRELNDQRLRHQAERQNLLKRSERDVQQARAYGLNNFIQSLLPVFDSLERGLASGDHAEHSVNAMLEGLQLTYDMLVNTLEKHNILVINPVGEAFNPEQHEAISTETHADHAPNTVVKVVQKGCVIKDRVVRPAMVVVADAQSGQQDA